MKERSHGDYLEDIYDAVEDIASFVNGMSKSTFLRDKKTINAVIRSLEVMGEASKKTPSRIKKRHPSIPWKKMEGMRNKMIHEYFGVDIEILWKTAKENVPLLKPLIEGLLKEIYG